MKLLGLVAWAPFGAANCWTRWHSPSRARLQQARGWETFWSASGSSWKNLVVVGNTVVTWHEKNKQNKNVNAKLAVKRRLRFSLPLMAKDRVRRSASKVNDLTNFSTTLTTVVRSVTKIRYYDVTEGCMSQRRQRKPSIILTVRRPPVIIFSTDKFNNRKMVSLRQQQR